MKRFGIISALASCVCLVAIFLGCQSTAVTSAKLYISQENYDKAIEQLEVEVQTNPSNAEAFYLLGFAHGHQNNYKEMVKAFDGSLAVSNKFANDITNVRKKYWIDSFNRGVRKIQNDQAKEAIADFETAIIIDPNEAGSYKNLAFAYLKLMDDDKASQYYKKALEVDPSDAKTWLNYGIHNYNMQNYQAAIDALTKHLELDPSNNEAVTYIAMSYDLMGDREKAKDFYDNALAKNPDDPNLYFNRGRLYIMRDDYESAIKDFEKVIEVHPEDYDALIQLGTAYINIGEGFSKERTELENGNGSSSRIAELKEKEKSNYQNAKKYLEMAKNIKSEDPNLWNNLGVIYVRLGMAKEGEEAFKRAGELNE